jgi:hypothetical protein
MRLWSSLALLITGAALAEDIAIFQPPQYKEKLLVRPALAPPARVQPTEGDLTMAWELLRGIWPDLKLVESGSDVVLWDHSRGARPSIELNFHDRQLLADWLLREQGYGLCTTANRARVIGGGRDGVLYGVALLAQLLPLVGVAAELTSIDLREYPDLRFCEASDWLLNIEIKHWGLDCGRAEESYICLVRQKLDRAACFKLNMVLIGGLG